MIFPRLIPSVAVPMSFIDIIKTISLSIFLNCNKRFKTYLCKSTSFEHSVLFPSGRVALFEFLCELSSTSNKKEVIIPAYTCPTVIYSVIKADLIPVLADIDVESFNISPKEIKANINDNTLAIIVAHMFGKMADMQTIFEISNEKKIPLIEDAAQAADIYKSSNITKIGKYSNYVLLSFGKGKSMSTLEGGALLTNDESIAKKLVKVSEHYPMPNLIKHFKLFLKLFLYAIGINPIVFKFINILRIPYTEINYGIFEEKYRFTNLQSALGIVMINKLHKLNLERIHNALNILDVIENICNIKTNGTENNLYLRLPIFINDNKLRVEIIKNLNKADILCSHSTFPVLKNYSEKIKNKTGHFNNSKIVSEKLIAIPTNHFVKNKDVCKIIDVIENSVKNHKNIVL